MPQFPAIVKEIAYRVRQDDSPITIKAKVGSAQRGVPVAILDADTVIPENPLPDGTVQFNVGASSSLIDHVVRVQTFVSDVNPKTNLTIVNYEISGGIQTVADNTQGEVEQEGGRNGHFFFITFQA